MIVYKIKKQCTPESCAFYWIFPLMYAKKSNRNDKITYYFPKA